MRIKFKMLTFTQVVSQTTGSSWGLLLGAKYTNIRFFPSALHSHPTLSQRVWMLLWLLCDSRSSAYWIHRRLVVSRSIGAIGDSTSRCRSHTHDRTGVEIKRQEKCACSITENYLSGRGVEFHHDAGTHVPCSDRVDPLVRKECERRPVTQCQVVPETTGSDGSCVQRDTSWPAVHETLTVVALLPLQRSVYYW